MYAYTYTSYVRIYTYICTQMHVDLICTHIHVNLIAVHILRVTHTHTHTHTFAEQAQFWAERDERGYYAPGD